jgi:hypothetical protein
VRCTGMKKSTNTTKLKIMHPVDADRNMCRHQLHDNIYPIIALLFCGMIHLYLWFHCDHMFTCAYFVIQESDDFREVDEMSSMINMTSATEARTKLQGSRWNDDRHRSMGRRSSMISMDLLRLRIHVAFVCVQANFV